MSSQEYQYHREPRSVFTSCPECHKWLWDDDSDQFETTCSDCGWVDDTVNPLPIEVEKGQVYMRNLIEKVDFGVKLTPNEQQLLAQAVVYAQENQK